MIYAYTGSEDLYSLLTETGKGIMTVSEEKRLGKAAAAAYFFASSGDFCTNTRIANGACARIKLRFGDDDGKEFYLVDYASAGRGRETSITAWLPTK